MSEMQILPEPNATTVIIEHMAVPALRSWLIMRGWTQSESAPAYPEFNTWELESSNPAKRHNDYLYLYKSGKINLYGKYSTDIINDIIKWAGVNGLPIKVEPIEK